MSPERTIMPRSSDAVDITVLINGHREGPLLAQAIRSARRAIRAAEAEERRCEILLVLDRSDEATRATADNVLGPDDRLIAIDVGDPAEARNIGAANAKGRALALLDGDDLFGSRWLVEAYAALARHDFGDVCLHPEYTVIFGEEQAIWQHIGMEHPDFRVRHLMFENYFTALSFAPTDLYRRHPFRASGSETGFSHEDWAWIRDTIHHGVEHFVVPETLHAVRRRRLSRLTRARFGAELPVPTPLFSGRDIRLG